LINPFGWVGYGLAYAGFIVCSWWAQNGWKVILGIFSGFLFALGGAKQLSKIPLLPDGLLVIIGLALLVAGFFVGMWSWILGVLLIILGAIGVWI
jgi:hypothetical protein